MGKDYSEDEPEESQQMTEEDEEEMEEVDADVGDVAEEDEDGEDPGTPESADEAETDDDVPEGPQSPTKREVARRERERLKELKKKQKHELESFREQQNALIDADAGAKAKGRLQYLLQQTEIFAHFAQGGHGAEAVKAKPKGRGRFGSKMTEKEEDEEYLKETEEDDPVIGGGTRLTVQPSCIQGKMREYQLAGLNWMIKLYENGINGILADEMGLGKTLQTISLLGYLHEFRGITGPHMIVVPKSTLGNWMNELKRFCPVLRCFKFHGPQEERIRQRDEELVAGKFDVCVTSFEVAIKEKSALRKFSWRYIIIDEAHRIKNENSLLSKTMRLFSSNFRMLITGTPLQNNLHELWALLNFLLPELFSSAEKFDEYFDVSGDNFQKEVVHQLHKVLQPFLLRRLKSDVERGLPPKKEMILKVGMSEMQKQYYKSLLQKDIDVINSGGERSRLLNIAMQLRKCCNHPYLFQGAEPGPPYMTGEHLIENAGKMVLLDKLLPKLKARNSRVLIFSQMTRLLDILEDYSLYRGYEYCRIDGNTSGEDREASIEAYNKENSTKFIFLLSTRAGGLGINLATADIVILYDSDWNPQVDLQAMDRAHRIGQKKEVQVFRFCQEATIEEKVIERAYKKLALDALVIQQGRLAEAKAVNKEELLQMVRFGAQKVFESSDTSTITDADVDQIIAKGEENTKELNEKMKVFTDDALKFKMDDSNLYNNISLEGGEGDKEAVGDLKRKIAENWIEPPKRERKRNYSEAEYYKQAMQRAAGPSRAREPKMPRMPQLHDFQFYNTGRIEELFRKQYNHAMQAHLRREGRESGGAEDNADNEESEPLTAEEKEEWDQLLVEGFQNWSRRDFNAFTRACEKYGRKDIANIATEIEGKTVDEVAQYARVFWQRYAEIADFEKFIKNIEKGEARIMRKDEIMKAIAKKLERYKLPWFEMKLQYGQNKGKNWTEDVDRFIMCQVHRLGYGNWDELKASFRTSPMFRFDWYAKSRTPAELARRCDTLIRLVEKENQEVEEREKAARKEAKKAKASGLAPLKSLSKNATSSGKIRKSTPSKGARLSLGKGVDSGDEVGKKLQKKRKQASMDDFVDPSAMYKKKKQE